eukprot:SAG31_NODE_19004_length_611_cov_0.658915_1_plen_117_part_01
MVLAYFIKKSVRISGYRKRAEFEVKHSIQIYSGTRVPVHHGSARDRPAAAREIFCPTGFTAVLNLVLRSIYFFRAPLARILIFFYMYLLLIVRPSIGTWRAGGVTQISAGWGSSIIS